MKIVPLARSLNRDPLYFLSSLFCDRRFDPCIMQIMIGPSADRRDQHQGATSPINKGDRPPSLSVILLASLNAITIDIEGDETSESISDFGRVRHSSFHDQRCAVRTCQSDRDARKARE
jgi:hypothetical protein